MELLQITEVSGEILEYGLGGLIVLVLIFVIIYIYKEAKTKQEALEKELRDQKDKYDAKIEEMRLEANALKDEKFEIYDEVKTMTNSFIMTFQDLINKSDKIPSEVVADVNPIVAKGIANVTKALTDLHFTILQKRQDVEK